MGEFKWLVNVRFYYQPVADGISRQNELTGDLIICTCAVCVADKISSGIVAARISYNINEYLVEFIGNGAGFRTWVPPLV